MITVFTNARVFDGTSMIDGMSAIVIEGDRVMEVAKRVPASADLVVDCDKRYLLPGLIDAHFHANSPSFDIFGTDHLPPSLLANHAAKILEGALERGFTTVRDAGGGDIGLWMAIEQRLIAGPRFFYSGRALSQTGGHGDFRPGAHHEYCTCAAYEGALSIVADGVDAVRKAAREELRKGAHQVKIFVSGGGLSPTDPMWMPQFTEEEIRAVVYEAATRRKYVMAHSHTDDASRRCAEYGVRSIEHGSLIHRDDTARLIASRGSYVVPTLSVVDVLQRHGPQLNIPPMSLTKIKDNAEQMFRAVEICQRAGVKLGLGTDLMDHRFHPMQAGELELRGRVSGAIDVLRSATSVNAELMQQDGQLGCIRPGAYADLLVLNGDPLLDLSLFRQLENMPIVMKGGKFVRNRLASA